MITDATGKIVWRWDSAPFGETAANDDPDADGIAFVYNLRFPGQVFDAETKLHYNYFRDYNPGTGRYVQSDPIGLSGGVNTYSYVEANPVLYLDNFGLARKRAPTGADHANSKSNPRESRLYKVFDACGNFVKWGISVNPKKRYTKKKLAKIGGDSVVDTGLSGPRAEMLEMERFLVERYPGPKNHEPWRGTKIGCSCDISL